MQHEAVILAIGWINCTHNSLLSSIFPGVQSCRRAFSSQVRMLTSVLTETSLTVVLHPVHSVSNLSWPSSVYSKYRSTSKPDLFVEVYVDQKLVQKSKVLKKDIEPKWDEIITIPSFARESSDLVMKLKHKSSLSSNPCFGVVKLTVGQLLRLSKGLGHGPKNTMYDAHGFLSASINIVEMSQARENALLSIREDFEGRDIESSAPVPSIPPAVEDLANTIFANKDVLQSLGTVLNKIKRIADVTVDVVDTLESLEFFVQGSFARQKTNTNSNAVDQAYEKQKETDAAVLALFEQLEALFSFVDDVESLPEKLQRLKDIITRVLEQTTECGIFFREYTGHGFAGRFVGQVVSNRVQMISALSAKLGQLEADLKSGMMLHTAFLSSQTKEGVDRLVKSDILRGLKPANMSAVERSPCLPGTQQTHLKEVIDWLMTPSDQNILWLHGAAGLGKSTIANTVAEHFGGLHRRGAFLIFDRNSPQESAPSRVITTLAFQLAQHNAAIGAAVAAAIDQQPESVSDPLATQFKSLLVEPLRAAAKHIEGPLIIILDALDECGDAASRRKLLDMLSQDFNQLPDNFRILITSRPDHDIKGALGSCSHIHTIDLSIASDADMRIYIKHEMKRYYKNHHEIDELPINWPGEEVIGRLVLYAAGLFIWAATAMKLLFNADDPQRWLDGLLGHKHPDFSLHALYKTALLSASKWEPGETTNDYKKILGIIIISQIPLTDDTIATLLGFRDGGRACRTVLQRLGCVVQWSKGQPARTLHKSFPDYLTDRNHCASEPWFIDVQEHQHALALACLRIMNDQLHFNMCNLKTSHIPNSQISDLAGRIEKAIPPSLSYSCLFWGDHIRQTLTENPSLEPLILEFFEQKFLYWSEVLSLMGEVRSLASTMVVLKDSIANTSSKVKAFAQDGLSFSRVFAQAIAFSAPHIYVSCIPFAPRASKIKQQYAPLVPKMLGMKSGMDDSWPALQQIFEELTSWVLSVAFSSDGQRIVSGSNDQSVRVWDAETGVLIAGPFEGLADDVRSVAFSPDGQRMASGSKDGSVRVWNAETGYLLAGPFEGHNGSLMSVAFSPDGRIIASGSSDGTIRLWDAQEGTPLVVPLEGHTGSVNSVAFSSDGQRIASGSDDNSVRVWATDTGALVAETLEGHTHGVNSVAFSPDGQRIASGSNDQSVRMWDALDGTPLAEPLQCYAGRVNSVAFSPDGQRFASGSDDGSVRVWDAGTYVLIGEPFKGHTSIVVSVAFSLDGRRIASSSCDRSIRVWDAETGTLTAELFKGHTHQINSVAVSSDGQHIVSGSADCSVRSWNTATGALFAGPFEGCTDCVMSVALSPDGRRIASGSDDGYVQVWDAGTCALIAAPFEGHTGGVKSVAFSPDGQHIASGSADESVRVWDVETGTPIAKPFEGHIGTVWTVVFSLDGQRIASGSSDLSVRLWDLETGAPIAEAFEGHTSLVMSVAFSPDGRRIASGSCDRSVRVWDAETGTLNAKPFKGHTGGVYAVAFSPDGQRIASGSDDQSVRIWDTETGALIAGPFKEHTDAVTSVAISLDGRRLVSSGHLTIRVYDFTQMSAAPKPRGIASSSSDQVSSDDSDEGDNGFGNYSRLEHGWMLNRAGGLLFWVPPEHREGLWWPHNKMVISERSTCLDMENFVHGEDWTRCHI
ncbi:hypothetical protein HWV62_12428 [Athelia sp. TMB]|nr:hypothetical protein HWV62_12428 [Athelia sp. TMB]